MTQRDLERTRSGNVYESMVERGLMDELNISREELINLKKNPFKAGMYKNVLIAVLAVLGGVATYGISKATGVDAILAYPAFGGVSAFFSWRFANQLVECARFRGMQKKHNNPKFQDQEIEAAMYEEDSDTRLSLRKRATVVLRQRMSLFAGNSNIG